MRTTGVATLLALGLAGSAQADGIYAFYGLRNFGAATSVADDGTVLLVAWVALWTVFVLGVVEPAARFTNAASQAAQVERSRT